MSKSGAAAVNKTLREVAGLLDGEIIGDPEVIITGISGIKEAKQGDITFLANTRYLPLIHQTKASAVITSRDIKEAPLPILQTDNPSLAFAKMVQLIAPSEIRHPQGIHPTAVIGKGVVLGKEVSVEPYAVIDDEAIIGDQTVLYMGVYVGHRAKIGSECLIYPHVTIRERVEIGNRVIIHSGSVIGSDGFGFSTVRGVHHKIPQIGTVVVEDDVEIGANVTIDRARFDKTWIKKGTKIDNLVQIAHNVVVGENSVIVAQTGISGSTLIGNNVILAGQSGIVGHVSIGDNAVVAAQSGVSKSIPPNTCVFGSPAKPFAQAKRTNAYIQRLPELAKTIARLQKRIEELEAKLNFQETWEEHKKAV